MRGFPEELAILLGHYCKLPLILSGGFCENKNILKTLKLSNADGVAIGSALHYRKNSVSKIKKFLKLNSFEIRL